MMKNIRPTVFLLPMLPLLSVVIISIIDLQMFLDISSAIYNWILQTFSDVFAISALIFVFTCIWAAFSPLGSIRIGGADATTLLSRWAWFSITLCTTLAIGILFWATAEPILHLYEPAGDILIPRSDAAAEFAIASLYMHWSITPYAIYTVPGLAFALAYYNFKKPYSLGGPISVLLGRDLKGWLVDIIDAVALLTLIAGVAASLGTGMLSIAGGVGRFTGLTTSAWLLAVIAIMIVTAFILSSVSGLQRGIRILSDINTKFFFVFVAIVFFAGPTMDLLSIGAKGLVQYVVDFIPRSLDIGEHADTEWFNDWTVFYFANWLAWAPMAALFLGKIARGYTVREYILITFAAPALFSMFWMAIFGGGAILIEAQESGVLKGILDTAGPEAVLYAFIERYPLSTVLSITVLFLSFISYVTAADSNTDAIASVCQKDPGKSAASSQGIMIKLIWGGLIGIVAWIMTAFAGVDGIRMLSNLGGFPALFIVILLNLSVWVMGSRYLAYLRTGDTDSTQKAL